MGTIAAQLTAIGKAMMENRSRLKHLPRLFAATMIIAVFFSGTAAHAQSESDLAAQAQNPIANLISLPFQNNTNF